MYLGEIVVANDRIATDCKNARVECCLAEPRFNSAHPDVSWVQTRDARPEDDSSRRRFCYRVVVDRSEPSLLSSLITLRLLCNKSRGFDNRKSRLCVGITL